MKLSVKTMTSCFLLGSVFVFSASSSASDDGTTDPIAHGEQAHETHCYKCHSDDVYTRENRLVKSIDALSKQVVRCKDGNDIPWFDEDTDAVVQFLNKKYYRF
jgi:mono/diheme cytochrome c family protein